MREEADRIIAEEGWTKAAMGRMRKIDSFLKESQRLNSIGTSKSPMSGLELCAHCVSVLMSRKALQDWTLSDGTLIPKGTFIGIASDAMNKDEVRLPLLL
jgi:hypothetical protein